MKFKGITMKITLSTIERIQLLQLLPTEGNFKTLKVLHTVKVKKLGFQDEELEKLKFRTVGNQTQWDAAPDAEIEFSKVELEFMSATLRERSSKGTLPMEAVTVYEKIVGEE